MAMPTLYSIGHSNHSFEKFFDMLAAHGIEMLVDIRMLPRSRYNPQFSQESLAANLGAHGITYQHMKALGGKRPARPGSINTAFRTGGGFQGYADYMQTPPFYGALMDLMKLSAAARLAFMCAEADPNHCHRLLVSDALTAQGASVIHILPNGQKSHTMTPFACVDAGQITYPDQGPKQLSLF